MAATPAFAKEGSFLWEADFQTWPTMAEGSAGSGSPSNKEKVQKEEESLLLKLGACPCFSHSSPAQIGSQARELN